MRSLLTLAALVTLTAPAWAQEGPPSGYAAYELARSRSCVDVIARMDVVDAQLAPFAARTQRLFVIAQTIALEERSVVDSLDVADPVEAEVRQWFISDTELAERFVAEGDSALITRRALAREAIKARLNTALQSVQEEAKAILDAAGTLPQETGPCDGAIFVRSAVLEACATTTSAVCDAAAAGEPGGRFRFVDSPDGLWDIQEMRPWTEPGPLVIGANGQLDGARTIALARSGNLALTVAFGPMLRDKADLSAEELERFRTIDDSLGVVFDHPDIAVVPSLSLRAAAPEPLAGETLYVLHFGEPEDADVVWTGPAGTGAAIAASVVLEPLHVMRLSSGEPLSFTAVREDESGEAEALYSIPFMPLNQGRATSALLGYMATQLSLDVSRLVPPTGG